MEGWKIFYMVHVIFINYYFYFSLIWNWRMSAVFCDQSEWSHQSHSISPVGWVRVGFMKFPGWNLYLIVCCCEIDEMEINQQKHVKFLGVVVDEKLSWEAHIAHCKRKVTSALFALRASHACLNEEASKLLYHTLIYIYILIFAMVCIFGVLLI